MLAIGRFDQACTRLGEHVVDGIGNQCLLGGEVGIEAAMRQPGFGHDRGHADAVGAGAANGAGRHVEDLFSRLLLVCLVVSHRRSSFNMINIIL